MSYLYRRTVIVYSALLSGLRLPKRRYCALGCAQIVRWGNQNLQSPNARRDGNNVEQFDGLVHAHRKVALGRECGHSAANIAGERLQLFHRDELNLSLSRHSRQRLQVQFLIAGDHRQADSIAVAARDQRLENLLRRQTNLGRNRFRSKIVGIDLVLAQLVVDSHLVEQPRRVCLLSRFHVYSVQSLAERRPIVRLLLHWVLSALAVWIVAHVVPGISVSGPVAALIAAAAIGLINATIGLVLKILTFPLTLLTLGLFWFVINALMLELAAAVVTGFHVRDFVAAFIGAVLLSIVSSVLQWLVIPRRNAS
jgi:putative membrane protein